MANQTFIVAVKNGEERLMTEIQHKMLGGEKSGWKKVGEVSSVEEYRKTVREKFYSGHTAQQKSVNQVKTQPVVIPKEIMEMRNKKQEQVQEEVKTVESAGGDSGTMEIFDGVNGTEQQQAKGDGKKQAVKGAGK